MTLAFYSMMGALATAFGLAKALTEYLDYLSTIMDQQTADAINETIAINELIKSLRP